MRKSCWGLLFLLLFTGRAAPPLTEAEKTEKEYHSLLTFDDDSLSEVERLREEIHTKTGLELAKIKDLNQRLIADKIFAIRGAYSQFLERHPDHIKAKMAFASFLYDEGETETAIKHWRQVLQRDPKNAAAHNNLANHFGHAGEWKLALTEYESALAILPTESLYHFNYASVMDLYRKEIAPARGWSEMEMTRRIVSELKIARDLSPTEFPYAKTYASSLDNGVPPDWKEALAAWKFCLQLSGKPEETDFVNANAARVCLELGDKSQAHAFIAAMVLPFSLPMKQDLEKRLQKLP